MPLPVAPGPAGAAGAAWGCPVGLAAAPPGALCAPGGSALAGGACHQRLQALPEAGWLVVLASVPGGGVLNLRSEVGCGWPGGWEGSGQKTGDEQKFATTHYRPLNEVAPPLTQARSVSRTTLFKATVYRKETTFAHAEAFSMTVAYSRDGGECMI